MIAPIAVMLVDDSAVVRGLMSRALKQDPQLAIAATASDGEMAIKVLQQQPIDVIVLDIEMPRMDGLTALPKLIELSPHTRIIMASSLTLRNAEISMKAMSLGAADYVPKPSSREDPGAIDAFYEEIRTKVLALGRAAKQSRTTQHALIQSPAATQAVFSSESHRRTPADHLHYPAHRIDAIAIASSTGGPQALGKVLNGLKDDLQRVPVFITQHMPPKFTGLLADHLARDTGLVCIEGVHGDTVKPGVVYIAPGDYHMCVERADQGFTIKLNQDPPVNYCRPAADPMLGSLAALYREHMLAVVLTGMGSDGLGGCKEIVVQQGTVIAQDEATSVVWGMPGAVANAGLTKAILPISQIAPYVIQALGGGLAARRV